MKMMIMLMTTTTTTVVVVHGWTSPPGSSSSGGGTTTVKPIVTTTATTTRRGGNRSSIGGGGNISHSRRNLVTIRRISRGGGGSSSSASSHSNTALHNTPVNTDTKCPASNFMAIFGSIWGTGGVLYILYKAISRVFPIAYEPLKKATATAASLQLTQFQWICYYISILFFGYIEGYKGFQTKFSPLVVKRSFTLVVGSPQATLINYIFAPLYSMGLLHATKKRKITSWSITLGVTLLVSIVKRLNEPWRNIIDAGVVCGLSYGMISILLIYIKSWITGSTPNNIDPCLPSPTDASN